MITTRYIPDLVGIVVGRAGHGASYAFGHHAEVERILIEKDGNPNKPHKFPLVWLVTPFKEVSQQGYYAIVPELHFVLAHATSITYSMEERRDNVFIPILYPLLADLIEQIKLSKDFVTKGEPEFEKMDMQYARVDSTGKNLFNDFVDVIDLKLKNIIVKKEQIFC